MGKKKTALTPEILKKIKGLVKSGVTTKLDIFKELEPELGMSRTSFYRNIKEHAGDLGLPPREPLKKYKKKSKKVEHIPKEVAGIYLNYPESPKYQPTLYKTVSDSDIQYAIDYGARCIDDVISVLRNVPGFYLSPMRIRVAVTRGGISFPSNSSPSLLNPSEYIRKQIEEDEHIKFETVDEYRISLLNQGILPDTCDEKMFRSFMHVSTKDRVEKRRDGVDTLIQKSEYQGQVKTIEQTLYSEPVMSAKDLARKTGLSYDSLRSILSKEDELSELLELAKEDARTAHYKKAIQERPYLTDAAIARFAGSPRQSLSASIDRNPGLAKFFEETRRIYQKRQAKRAKLLGVIKSIGQGDTKRLIDALTRLYVSVAAGNDTSIMQEAIAIASEHENSKHANGRSFLDLVGPIAMVLRRNSGEDLSMQEIADACGINYGQVNSIITATGLSQKKKNYWLDLPSYGPAIKRAIKAKIPVPSLVEILSLPTSSKAMYTYLYSRSVHPSSQRISIGNPSMEGYAALAEQTVSKIYLEIDQGENLQTIAEAYEIPLSVVQRINQERKKYAKPITNKLQSVFMHPTWDKPYVTDELREHLAKVDAFYEARPTGEEAILSLEDAIEYANIDQSLAKILETQQARQIYEPDLKAA